MFRERGIHSVSVRPGWWFHSFVFCVRVDLGGIAIAKESWRILAK